MYTKRQSLKCKCPIPLHSHFYEGNTLNSFIAFLCFYLLFLGVFILCGFFFFKSVLDIICWILAKEDEHLVLLSSLMCTQIHIHFIFPFSQYDYNLHVWLINYCFTLKFCKRAKNLWAYSNTLNSWLFHYFFLFPCFFFVSGRHSFRNGRALQAPALIWTDWGWGFCIAIVLEPSFIVTDFSLSLFLISLFFNWRIIALQNFVVFCQTSTWISHRYILSLLNLPSTSLAIPLL